MRQIVGDMEVKRARTFVLNAIDIEVPKRNEDGELIEDVDEWLDENHEDWTEQFEDKFNKLFDEHTLRNGGMLTASAVRTLRKSGHPVLIAGVVSINHKTGTDRPARRARGVVCVRVRGVWCVVWYRVRIVHGKQAAAKPRAAAAAVLVRAPNALAPLTKTIAKVQQPSRPARP